MTTPVNPALIPPGPSGVPAVQPTQRTSRVADGASGGNFAQVLRDRASVTTSTTSAPVVFSGHALQRIERRGITMDAATQKRLGEGVDRAASKGSRAAVVLVDDNAFVVGVPSRTVITAVGRDNMKEHVFTNIDSAVIA
ncbi:MAG: TIGR02530 family flagellar biosynthesis protein [Solirubrobacteraceae bacterium]|nr:TIGR02530 family flagellar biosynthesis protein [Patulibacter sp.]